MLGLLTLLTWFGCKAGQEQSCSDQIEHQQQRLELRLAH